jgi:hypothetical protein
VTLRRTHSQSMQRAHTRTAIDVGVVDALLHRTVNHPMSQTEFAVPRVSVAIGRLGRHLIASNLSASTLTPDRPSLLPISVQVTPSPSSRTGWVASRSMANEFG